MYTLSVWCTLSASTATKDCDKCDDVLDYAEDNDFELVDADNRNIIFVGRSNAGKTTLINVLKDKKHSPALATFMRGTEDATLETFTMQSEFYQQNLHFNIMDTPGLFEKTISLDDKRTNEVILDMIKKCVDSEITKINHVYFVMSIEDGINDNDLKAFDLFAQLFVGMESKISVILSRAQSTAPDEYDHYIEQFKKMPELEKIYAAIEGRIFFLGAAQQKKSSNMEFVQANVNRQRNAVFEHIIKQNTTYDVKQLKIYQDNIKFLKELREDFALCCENQKTCEKLEKFDRFIKHYIPSQDMTQKKEAKDEL